MNPREHSSYHHPPHHGNLSSYVRGFVASLVCSVIAFVLVEDHVASGHETFSHHFLIFTVLTLAIIQLGVQLVYFLHLGRESSPRWNLTIFAYAAVLLICLVGGSLWIMNNLNNNLMMSPPEMDSYMMNQ